MRSNKSQRSWLGSLELEAHSSGDRTRLKKVKHSGPLRVQRPFYPADDGQCHVYLLHPPGGMACGDHLKFDIHCTKNTHLLVTTPAAGKVYGLKGLAGEQVQRFDLTVAEHAMLEWVPQETIVYDSAVLKQFVDINLEPSSSLIAMDIQCLGRRLSGETFSSGSIQLHLQVCVAGVPLHIERLSAAPESQTSLFKSLAGFQSRSVTGTLLMYSDKFTEATHDEGVWPQLSSQESLISVTQKGKLMIARYLGDKPEEARHLLNQYRNAAVEIIQGRPAVTPRIWNT